MADNNYLFVYFYTFKFSFEIIDCEMLKNILILSMKQNYIILNK